MEEHWSPRRLVVRSKLTTATAIGLYTALAAITFGAAPGLLLAQVVPARWDVTVPRGQTREIDFTTNEGTWMSVDISPDGRWIVFDLLAHIYRVPIEGGEAECLTQASGVALNYHPRYSPDGRSIAFISDRGGQDNLWVMNADGSDPRPVLLDPETRMTEPAWTPDGRHLLVTRTFQKSGFSSVSRRIWMIPVDGSEGVEVAGGDSWHAHDASASPDGRWVYFHRSVSDEGPFYSVGTGNHVERVDLETGRVEEVTQTRPGKTPTQAFASQVSPDGTRLAFARRLPEGSLFYRGHQFRPRNALWIRDLARGTERVAMDPISLDQSTANTNRRFQVLPSYSWSRDGESIVISQGGKIRRLWVASGEVETIPFTARVSRTISEAPRARIEITEEPFVARFLRWPASSPDGSRLVFEAVGRLWIMDLPDGTPRPLTAASGGAFELTPSWSPDGRWLAFATWDDTAGGHLWKVSADGSEAERLTTEPGAYLYPAWSPDGRWLVVTRGTGPWSDNLWEELVRIPASGGVAELVAGTGSGHEYPRSSRSFSPSFGASLRGSIGTDGRIYYNERDDEWDALIRSVRADGSDPRAHVFVDEDEDVALSADRRWLAISWWDVAVALFPDDTAAGPAPYVWAAEEGERLFPHRLSLEGGLYPRWRNATTLEFVSGNRYVTYDVTSGETDTVDIELRVPRDIPNGVVALTGARIIPLAGREVIERGTVVVEDSRIACVGDCDASRADRVVDVSGMTIMPGIVDTHAHGLEWAPFTPQHWHESARYLAYGVTTIREAGLGDPGTAFPVAQLTDAGRLVGPRTLSVGWRMNIYASAGTAEAVEHEVGRRISWGAVALKDYLLPRREQRQWLADAARRHRVTLTAEGGGLIYNLGLVMDGHTGWEHGLQAVPPFQDVAQFFAQAGAVYSPTVSVITSAGRERGEDYFLARADLWEDPKERRFVPWWTLFRARNTSRHPLEEYSFPLTAEGVADILRAGGHAAIGGHGEHHGLDSHWEIWAYASALAPMEALEMATMGGAYFLGLDHELGSIEVGKLADLVVLNANPLDDIENTADIAYVMKGGRLYDDDTLDEVWPTTRPYGAYPWANPDLFRADTRGVDYWDASSRQPTPESR